MKTIFTCLLVSVALFGFGQQNTFKVRSFAPDYGITNQIIQLNDGSFVRVGNNSISVRDGISILQTDAGGVLLSSKILNPPQMIYNDFGYSLTKTADGGFVITGKSNELATLIKYKEDGTPQWEKQYGANYVSLDPYKILQTADGGYLIANDAFGFIDADSLGFSIFLLKTDSIGNIEFCKRYAGYGQNRAAAVTATTDGNYALLGVKNYPGSIDTNYLVKLKPDGSILWSRNLFSNDLYVYPYDVSASSDGGIVIAGKAFTKASPRITQSMMIKYDSTGNLLWSKTMATTGISDNYAQAVTEDKDGGYLFAGQLATYSDANHTILDTAYGYIVKTDTSGMLLWTKTFEPDHEGLIEFNSIIHTLDGGHAISGAGYFLEPDSSYSSKTLIYKFSSDFGICNEVAGSNGAIQNFDVINGTANFTPVDGTLDIFITNINLVDGGTVENVCSSVLPLQLLSFNASLQNKSVAVQWTTANEINTSYFTVEKSKDAVAFSALQQVAAKGNSAGVQSYNTTDLQPLPGTSYYRLKEVDKDGKTTYSSVVPVTILNNGAIVISPNPVQNSIRVVMQSTASASLTCQVIDMKGTVLATQKTSVSTGRNEIIIPDASLAKGVYVLKVIENNATQTIRFVKE